MLLRRAWPMLAFLGALLAPPAELDAQTNQMDLTELPLEELMKLDVPKVYGASKLEQKTTEAPSSVTIITADEIRKQGYRTLADVLGSVQGFNISYDRNYAFPRAQGISLGDFLTGCSCSWTATGSITTSTTARPLTRPSSWTLIWWTGSKSFAAPAPLSTATTPFSV